MKRSILYPTLVLLAAVAGAVELPPVVVTTEPAAPTLDAQATPAAVSQVKAEPGGETRADPLYALPDAAPNLTLSRSTAPTFGDIYAVRGIANTEFFSDPGLVLYVDDAPAGEAMSYPLDLLDVASVDIWRGPQGSRFGRNAAGGVLDVTTRRPTDEWVTALSAGYSSFDTELYRASVQGPIQPGELHLGLSGSYGRSDGFIDNPRRGGTVDASETSAGRLFLGWTPADDWDIRLTLTGDRSEGGVRLVPVDGAYDEVASDVDQTAEAESSAQVLRARRTLPGAILTSITTHRDYTLDPMLLDLDLSPTPGGTALIKQDATWWSEELRLESPDASAEWRWRGGLFAAGTERDGDDTRSFVAPVAPGVYLPVAQRTIYTLDDADYALFGQLTYAGAERLGVTVGGRVDYAERGVERVKTGMLAMPVPDLDDDEQYLNVAPQVTVDYRVDEAMLAYVASGLGFKPGGFSAYIDPPQSGEFDTERNWTSEAGVKSEWLERRLLANVTVFHSEITDYQVEHNLVGTTDRTVLNAPEVTAQGVEAEVVGRLGGGFELSAAAGYTDIEFDEFRDPTTGSDLAGRRPPYVPEFDARLAAQYRAAGGFFARVEYLATGETFFDEANTDALTESGFGLVNARVGYDAGTYTVSLFGYNLTDEEYFSRRLQLEEVAGVPGAPLTVGLSASVKL